MIPLKKTFCGLVLILKKLKPRCLLCKPSVVLIFTSVSAIVFVSALVATGVNKIKNEKHAPGQAAERRSVRSPIPSPTVRCPCNPHNVSREFLRLSDLALEDPYEGGSSRGVLASRHPNIGGQMMLGNMSHCQILPFVTGLHWDGVWQLATVADGADRTRYLLYSAFCDRNDEGACTAVRIIVMLEGPRPPAVPFCHLWTNTSTSPTAVRANPPVFLDYQGATNQLRPHLLTCPVPAPFTQVAGVSVSTLACSPLTNMLEIREDEFEPLHTSAPSALVNGSRKHDAVRVQISKSGQGGPALPFNVGVCGPALFYYHEDLSSRLVEWLEILRAMKVAKVFMYLTRAHPKIETVLRYYEKQGFVDVTTFTYPSPYVSDPILRRAWVGVERSKMFGLENVYFTDCILRHRHQHRYLLHLDPDELPMLGKYDNIGAFVKATTSRYRDKRKNIQLSWKTFHVDQPAGPSMAGVPKKYFFLSHNMLRKKCVKDACGKFKTLYDTRHTLGAYSHQALICAGRCQRHVVSSHTAYVAHYRRPCTGQGCSSPTAFVEETFLARRALSVQGAVDTVLRELWKREQGGK